MRKRVYSLVILVMLFACGLSEAVESARKFAGPLLTGCSVYQLGTDEFVVKLNGKNLPAPQVDIDDSSLTVTLEGAQAQKPQAIISSMTDFMELSPVLHNFELQNLSKDKDYKVTLQLEANSPLKLSSTVRTISGCTLRIKTLKRQELFTQYVPQPPKTSVIAPETSLPFSAEERTTIEFRDAELQDVFRLFMAALGRNIVLDASFPRDVLVTMTLVDVRIDEIMNYLLRTYDIACYSYGPNITAFGTREGLYKLSGARQIKAFNISYTTPATASTLLKALTGLQDSELTLDERTRTIYVNTNPAKLEEVTELLKNIDVPLRQVMIRASIFEFNDSATLDVQNSLNMVYDRWTFLSDPSNNTNSLSYIDQTYRQGRSAFDRYITSTFSALESKNKGRTIANPSVIAIEGQEASITLKQDIMYSAGVDDNRNTVWETTEVGPELKFTPIIEDNGYINLTITLNTGDYLGKDSDGNIITTDRNVKTQIRVKDGMPFVVGGLFQDSSVGLQTKFPILGDIPLLGALFRYKSNDTTKTQAVMIVTPYILDAR